MRREAGGGGKRLSCSPTKGKSIAIEKDAIGPIGLRPVMPEVGARTRRCVHRRLRLWCRGSEPKEVPLSTDCGAAPAARSSNTRGAVGLWINPALPVRNQNRGHPERTSTSIERHGDSYWFCAPEIELEAKVPIVVVKEDGCSADCEFRRWTLDVGGVQLDVRVDIEWTKMDASVVGGRVRSRA